MGCLFSSPNTKQPPASPIFTEVSDTKFQDEQVNESKLSDIEKTIAVCGATGKQGGNVVNALLATKKYNVRALTRNPSSEKAKALQEKGVEVVGADFDDVDTLATAFRGCASAFLVTNFWEHMDTKKEIQQGKNLGDACVQAGVKHVVWSTLMDTQKQKDDIPMIGEYKVPHFDGKAEISRYLDKLNLQTTHLYTAFYNENLLDILRAKKGEDGIKRLVIPLGDTRFPVVSVVDIGKAASHCLVNAITGEFYIASDKVTLAEMSKILTEVTSEETSFYSPSYEEYRSYGFPGCDDLSNMFQWFAVHQDMFCGKFNLDELKETVGVTDFRTWCLANADGLKG